MPSMDSDRLAAASVASQLRFLRPGQLRRQHPGPLADRASCSTEAGIISCTPRGLTLRTVCQRLRAFLRSVAAPSAN